MDGRALNAALRNTIGALIATVPRDQREGLLNAALNYARGVTVDIPSFWGMIPPSADAELAAKILGGAGSLLMSASQADSRDTLKSILQRAESIATDIPTLDFRSSVGRALPMAADPAETGEAGPPTVALTLLNAKAAGEEIDDEVSTLAALLAEKYDCYEHKFVLGGDPLAGGFFADLWAKIKQGAKNLFGIGVSKDEKAANKAAAAQQKADQAKAEALAKKISALVSQGMPYSQAVVQAQNELGYAVDYSAGSSPVVSTPAEEIAPEAPAEEVNIAPTETAQISGPVAQLLATSAEDSAARLKEISQALSSEESKMGKAKESLESESRNLAKIGWMRAISEAPDSVIDFLKEVVPQFSTPTASLQTAADLLAAARDSADVSKVRSLTTVLRALRNRQPGVATFIDSLLGGDPLTDQILERNTDTMDPEQFMHQDMSSPALAFHMKVLDADKKGGEL
jgi:hypothetical protein